MITHTIRMKALNCLATPFDVIKTKSFSPSLFHKEISNKKRICDMTQLANKHSSPQKSLMTQFFFIRVVLRKFLNQDNT